MDERSKKKIYNDRRWKAVRPVVLARDGGVCQIKLHCCRTQATTVDHIVPLDKGGAPFDPVNLRAACRPCNSAMAARGNDDVKVVAYAPSRVW